MKLIVFIGGSGLIVQLVLLQAPLGYELDCDRRRGLCVLTRQFLTKSEIERARISSIQRAEVPLRTSWSRSELRLILAARAKDGWLVARFESHAEAEEAAGRINAFLRDPNSRRLVLAGNVATIYWVASLLVPVVAALLVALMAALVRNRSRERDA